MRVIYTDGACIDNPGPGGWAAVFLGDGLAPVEIWGSEPDTTNNRMELRAAIEALRGLRPDDEVTLYSDSEYLIKGMTEWIHNWKLCGWRTSKNKPVVNRELWEILDSLDLGRVDWQWLRSHVGHPGNERADFLANAAAMSTIEIQLFDPAAVGNPQ